MTDYRALCVELLDALENAIRVIYHEDGTKHISTADTVIAKADAALAQPEPVGPTDEELNDTYWKAWHEHLDRTNSVLHAAGLRAVLARWGHPAIEPQADGEVAELVAALKNDAECAEAEHCDLLARPEPQGETDAAIEEAAKLIHASMRFAVPDNHYTRDWVERGNSLMQDEARRTARAVLALPLPEGGAA